MLEWVQCIFHKKHARTHDVELAFLHSVGSEGHVRVAKCQHTIFRARDGTSTNSTKSALGHVTANLCFCIWWDLWVI
jgi:hypothetical protein